MSHYFESVQKAFKIRKFIKQRNINQLPASVQKIIKGQQDNADKYEAEAQKLLREAILNAEVYVCSEHPTLHSDDPKKLIDQALTKLVTFIYNKLEKIRKNIERDDEILAVLNGTGQLTEDRRPENSEAADELLEFLDIQHKKGMPTSMAGIQSRYQAAPYGWKEIDIAYVTAMLISAQKIAIKYGGKTIQYNDLRLPDMLRKKTMIGSTAVQIREHLDTSKMANVRKFLIDYFHKTGIPQDEDGLVEFIVKAFETQRSELQVLLERFKEHKYPDRERLEVELSLTQEILDLHKDNIALVAGLLKKRDDLLDAQADAQRIKEFFQGQFKIFDAAFNLGLLLKDELHYFGKDTLEALKTMDQILTAKPFQYPRIPELNDLMARITDEHNHLLKKGREVLNEKVRACLEVLHAFDSPSVKNVIHKADNYFMSIKDQIASGQSLLKLDGLCMQMTQQKEALLQEIEQLNTPPAPLIPPVPVSHPVRQFTRQQLFPARHLKTQTDVENYVTQIRLRLIKIIQNGEEIQVD